MKLPRVLLVSGLTLSVLGLTVPGAVAGADRSADRSAVAAAKKKAKNVSYVGRGTVTDIDAEREVLTVDLESANRALRRVLRGETEGVEVRIGPRTDFIVDGEEGDLDLICPGDEVTVQVVTRRKLSGGFGNVKATKVAVTSAEDDCVEDDGLDELDENAF